MDKIFTHQVCCAAGGIEMADYVYTTAKEINSSLDTVMEKIKAKFAYPVFVKPANTGSSVGVTKAHNDEDLETALKLAAQFDRRILIEEFIDGYELETAVLGNDDPIVSCVGQILPSREFYSYESKYTDGTSGLIIDAPLPEGKTEELRSTAARIYKLFDCKGLSRVDFFMRKSDNAIIFNEINTIPGFTDISMYPKLFGKCGIPYSQLIERLIDYAQEKGIR